MTDIYSTSLRLHEEHQGKLEVASKVPLENSEDLSKAYTPGVAEPCRKIAQNPEDLYHYTLKANTVAVITDGSAILGLGDLGPAAALPVMEGKCLLFKRFGGVDAFPLCIDSRDVDEFIETVRRIAIVFGGINLEDIAAPRCFDIEEKLQQVLDIPVFHDDQHGTAIVALAAVINALKIAQKDPQDIKVAISGAGAAGMAITNILLAYGIKNIIVCDSKGALYRGRPDLVEEVADYKGYFSKYSVATFTNPEQEKGTLGDIIKGADVFIGVSAAGVLTSDMVASMAPKAIILAMANPIPEIMPDQALAAGAFLVGTGRSDFPNQINNVLAFPGMFKGALRTRIPRFDQAMFLRAALALVDLVPNPTPQKFIPSIFDPGVAEAVAASISV